MKKSSPKTPKAWEEKPSSNIELLMDTESQIYDASCSYHLSNLWFNMYDCYTKQ